MFLRLQPYQIPKRQTCKMPVQYGQGQHRLFDLHAPSTNFLFQMLFQPFTIYSTTLFPDLIYSLQLLPGMRFPIKIAICRPLARVKHVGSKATQILSESLGF
jgi:hypothetical protein